MLLHFGESVSLVVFWGSWAGYNDMESPKSLHICLEFGSDPQKSPSVISSGPKHSSFPSFELLYRGCDTNLSTLVVKVACCLT